MIRSTILLSLLLIIAASVIASPPVPQQDKKHSDEFYLIHGKKMLQELTQAIDIWHQANLDGDQQRIVQAQTYIMAIIRSDLDYSWDYIGQSETELYRKAEERKELQDVRPLGRDDRVDLRNDVASVKQAKIETKAKERIWKSISKATAFSNQYRLLGDYADLLRKQTGDAQLKLASGNQGNDLEREQDKKK